MSSKPPTISSIWGQTVGTLAGAWWRWAPQRVWRRSRSRTRAISCERCCMPALPSALRRLKLLLEYSGTRYHGWQIQPNAVTIQGTLEACLARLTNGPVRLHAAGRTDAGVHALGQVAHFDTASTIALPALVRGANSLLPEDIVVQQATEVTADFHARYAARRKTYTYVVHNYSIPSALRAPYAWHVPQALDLDAMRAAASVLLGHHDFSAFRAASCAARSPWRQ